MKKIVICCDGTWNTPDEEKEGISCATNVVKIAEAIAQRSDDGMEQRVYYHPGVGTSGSFLSQWFDGATGTGVSANILDAYRFLIMNYEAGDALYLFGFSRGAFTVRSLAGLIRNSGLLRPSALAKVDEAYQIYRSRRPSTDPREREATLFRKTYAVADTVPIRFIGVFDTVGSLGNPLFVNSVLQSLSFSVVGNQFHDTNLSSYVDNAFQALAIDEKRRNFLPALWRQQEHAKGQTLEQVWFAGVHSNVGGGYPVTGLSDIALEWMVSKAQKCGLTVGPLTMVGNPKEHPQESRKMFYRLIPRADRPIGEAPNGNESIHPSVVKKFKEDPAYRPVKLVEYFQKHPV